MPKSASRDNQILKVRLVSPDDMVNLSGSIYSFDRGLLRIQTSRLFEELEPVDIYIGPCHVRGEVMYSVEQGESFRTAVSLQRSSKANRRMDRRIPVEWRARVSVIGKDPCAFDAEVVDVSSSGFGLLSPSEIRASTRIAIETAACLGFGEVLHCRAEADGRFRLGVGLVELIGSATPKSASGPLKRLLRTFDR